MKIVLAAINAKYIHANLAIYSLRAFSNEYKEQIQIKEYTINQYTEDILADLYKEQADMVAFSWYIWNMGMVEELAELLHQLRPEMPIWFGGPEVSYDAAECLQRNHGVTGILRGEGEESFHELMQYYIGGSGKLQDIRGIIYREGGLLVDNGWREVMDLNKVPFVYEEMEDFKNKIIYYESSRGCPFSCSYCLSSIDKCLRFRDLELVKKELQFFIDHEIPQVKFVDRTFNCKHSHSMEIWSYIKEHDKGKTNFHFEVAADLLNEEELNLISTMRPGLIQLEIGVQSTNEQTIKEIHRTMKFSQVTEVVNRVHAAKNIHQHLDLIAGLPFEDYNSFHKSFCDVYALRPEQLQLGFLKVLKGSYMEEKTKDYELLYQNRPPYEVLSTKWLPYSDVIRLKGLEEMVEVYYNSRQFEHTMELLEQVFGDAFVMFEEMSNYYEEHGYYGVNHNRVARYEILYAFIKEVALVQYETLLTEEQFRQTLVMDLYLRENMKNRPAFAGDSLVSKEVERTFYDTEAEEHQYLKGYEKYDKRQLRKMTHLENIDGHLILFDYQNRNPLTNQATTYEVI